MGVESMEWFQTYSVMQTVKLMTHTQILKINCGVPQGSILNFGPNITSVLVGISKNVYEHKF